MTTFKRHNGTDWEYIGLPNNVGLSPQTIGYAQVVANQTGISADTDLTGLAVTVVVPEGRRIRISGMIQVQSATTSGTVLLRTKEGASQLQISQENYNTIGGNGKALHTDVVITPTAGSHTYKLSLQGTAGTIDMTVSATNPGYILVEDITGSTLPYSPSSTPAGLLAQIQNFGSGVTSANTTFVELASLNIAVPAGRTIKLSAKGHFSSSVAGDRVQYSIREGTTVLATGYRVMSGGSIGEEISFIAVISPSAGAHTYNVAFNRNTGTGTVTVYTNAGEPDSFIIEDITPTPSPGTGAPGSTLGYSQVIANTAYISSETDIPDLAVTVNVPAGRRLKVTGFIGFDRSVNDGLSRLSLKEGATYLQLRDGDTAGPAGNGSTELAVEGIITPSAGSHTYKLSLQVITGTGNTRVVAGPTFPSFILVEDITGAIWPLGSPVTSGLFSSEAWTPYVPTFSNLTIGNGVLTGRYMKMGRTVHLQGKLVFGTTTSFTSFGYMNLPFTAANAEAVGILYAQDSGLTHWAGVWPVQIGGLDGPLVSSGQPGSHWNATQPFTWGNNDWFQWSIVYEAVS